MTRIPQHLKIGGHTFTVTYEDLKDSVGETTFSDGIIKLQYDAIPSIKESTLLHEVFIHTLNTTFTDEETVHETLDSMIEQLYQVLVDNGFCFCKDHDDYNNLSKMQ